MFTCQRFGSWKGVEGKWALETLRFKDGPNITLIHARTGLELQNIVRVLQSKGLYSPLSKRVENWGECGRALIYGIVWGRTSLKQMHGHPQTIP